MKILFSLFLGYLLFVAGLEIFQEKLIFYPSAKVYSPPPDLNIKEVFFETEDGERLHGWWMQTDNKAQTVLFFHGNAGNISHRTQQLRILKELGLNALIFDYRGYGKSSGKIKKEADLYADGVAAWDFVTQTKNIAPGDIILWGKSIGGSIMAEIAQEKEVKAVIFESSFFSATEIAQAHFWYVPVKYLLRFKFEAGKKLPNIPSPILVIHSGDDEMISFVQGQKLFDHAPAPKAFLQISGSHNGGMIESKEEYVRGIREFLEEIED